MTIKATEVGKLLYVGTQFNMSANTDLVIKATSPSGVVTEFNKATDGVTAPAVDSPSLPVVGILPANTYMLYTTTATSFTEVGNWTICTRYVDATPKVFYGDDVTLTIGEAC